MKNLLRLIPAALLLIILLPSLGRSQASTDRSEIDQWLKDTANQGTIPVGTTITMANWQQYKTFMPLGMQKLFEGVYFWKMPADVQLDIGPTIHNFIPKSYRDTTEKYSQQTSMKILPNGHYLLQNYHGGTPFPNPQEPNKGWQILANIFFAYQPSMYVNTPDNPGLVWAVDRYGNASETIEDVVYRYSDYNTDPNFQQPLTYAPGTWYTEWIMIEQPEQARYTASLNLFYTDQETRPFS